MKEVSIRSEYLRTAKLLKDGGVENAAAEAGWLVRECLGCGAAELLSDTASAPLPPDFRRKVSLRAAGTPLQYILGSQDFCGIEIAVAKGVLIPRPQTETVVNRACTYIIENKIENPVIYDLCAGSGCVSIAIVNRDAISNRDTICNAVDGNNTCRVFAVEKYAAALRMLEKNLSLHSDMKGITAVKADILRSELRQLPDPDIIVSNPPYIISSEMPALQREVQHEPTTALDGGADGLRFYRRLAVLGVLRLKHGGLLCVEAGAGQAEDIKAIFAAAGLVGIGCDNDDEGIARAVYAVRL